jgi:hypothetical protein
MKKEINQVCGEMEILGTFYCKGICLPKFFPDTLGYNLITMNSIEKYNEIIDEYGSWEEYLKQTNMGRMKELYMEQQQQLENLPAMNFMLEDLKKENKELHNLMQGVAINYNKVIDETSTYTREDFFSDLEYILERFQNLN